MVFDSLKVLDFNSEYTCNFRILAALGGVISSRKQGKS